jgi:hypothetical protein
MSLVQVVSKNLSTAGTTQTSSAISTTAKNALAFCAVYKAVNAGVVTPSDSTGLTWNLVSTYSGGATGLTLAVWVASNITGNAANTFTFATTGADTPTFFVAEFSGRDLNVPFDLFLTASDTIAASGAHSTGTINTRGGDDLLAFNVSSALSQAYTSTGLWAIPPNGSVTTAAGYDAFVQYINSANNGNNANTYSVATADKLDAFIIALKPPSLPYSDEWLDAFVQDPEIYPVISIAQQQDVAQQTNEIDQDWVNETSDDDTWTSIEDQSSPVIADNVVVAINQYFGDEAEQLDEIPELVSFSVTYQNTDITPPLGSFNFDDPWDWFQEIDDDEWVARDTDILSADVVDITSQTFDDTWDDEDPDDFFADDFGNDDADLPQNDAWDHWQTDDDDYVVIDDYLAFNNPGLMPLTVEDGWQEHWSTDDDDYFIVDEYVLAPNPLINVEDPTWWDEEPDQFDGTTTDLIPVGTNNNRVINVEDTWDHWSTDDDDYFIVDEYALVDVIPNPLITVEDPFDQFVTDDDDYFIVDEYALVDNIPPIAQPPTDGWDFFITDDDDYVIPDDYAIIDVASSAQVPVEDGWDWSNTEDADDYVVVDDYASVDNTPIVVEDPWDHFVTDPDDELHLVLDADQVSVPQPTAIDDPWDWTQHEDDDEWLARNTDPVEPLSTLNVPTDGWDHFQTDDDDYAVPDDYAIVDVAIAASQFVDDPWDHFYESAEDDSFDYAVDSSAPPFNVYLTDPNFEVYMPEQVYTVMWLPAGMGS